MYVKGDRVVYPMYGAGVIVDLEDKYIDGHTSTYYVLSISVNNLKIMVAVDNVENVGMRHVMPSQQLSAIIEEAQDGGDLDKISWNQRYRENMNKIKSGCLSETTSVLKSLRRREKTKGLSSAEKKMLAIAKQIILSEIILSFDVEKNDAESILDTAVGI